MYTDLKNDDRLLWFAMRATYRRELVAKRLLDAAGIENYIPMQLKTKMTMGRKKKVLVPAVHNLIFVHTTRNIIREFKSRVQYLQYMMDYGRGEGGMSPIVVPDKQMEDFMAVVRTCQEDLEYMPVGNRSFPQGMKVRVRGGVLDGVEGVIARTGKSRDKKLVVTLSGLVSVATANVSPGEVEPL